MILVDDHGLLLYHMSPTSCALQEQSGYRRSFQIPGQLPVRQVLSQADACG